MTSTTLPADGFHPTLCRICPHGCGLLAELSGGKVTRMRGDPENPLYQGFICVKGRAQGGFLDHPDRLLHSLKRTGDGRFQPIPIDQALDEIADRLRRIHDARGPRAIATYMGTYVITNALNPIFHKAFADALGTPMRFFAQTIDKPGKVIARAKLGQWMAPPQNFDRPDAALLVGINPFVSFQGMPMGNPAKWLKAEMQRGMKLIVIDPRRTDVAARATLHLQPRPGHDIPILASMLKVILEEELHDAAFVAEEVSGVAALRGALAPFAPDRVVQQAGLRAEMLVRAARVFAGARRGFAIAGTGPNMSGRGTLTEYLLQSLDILAGHVLRAGEAVPSPGVLTPPPLPRAQAAPPQPAYGFGEKLRVRDLANTAAGLPSAAMAEEMLLDGPGRVRALISCNGNPVAAFPDHGRTVEALRSLDLLVQIDPWMSQTSRLADYVIAPKMPLEMAGTSYFTDKTNQMSHGYGTVAPYAQYAPALCAPPPGSDLIEEWRVFAELTRRMELPLRLGFQSGPFEPVPDDPLQEEQMLALATQGSRIPLEAVKAKPHGGFFPGEPIVVAEKEPGWSSRFVLDDADMIAELHEIGAAFAGDPPSDLPFRLICRRSPHVMNSACNNVAETNRGRGYNPAFMHPDDIERLGLGAGDEVVIQSPSGSIPAAVHPDADLLPGLVSMTHAFGGVGNDEDESWRETGSNVGRLTAIAEHYDRYSGQPRMSNIPVSVTARGG